MIPPLIKSETIVTDVLKIAEWGWNIELERSAAGTSLIVRTPTAHGYQTTIDAYGNVTEEISGNYCRIVHGNKFEQVHGNDIKVMNGAAIVKSETLLALSGPTLTLNPSELAVPFLLVKPDVIAKMMNPSDEQKEP